MKKSLRRALSICFAIILSVSLPSSSFTVNAVTDEVQEVITMLEGIDTLQQMQDNRSNYKVGKHYSATNATVVASHENARNGYETYIADMFIAREQAKKAFDALSEAEKAQIPGELVAKLDNELDTVFNSGTFNINKSEDEYKYQIICPDFMVYEVSSAYIRTGDVAGTFVVVDTSETGDTFTPDGRFTYGESNYDLAYCCDLLYLPKNGTLYKRTNLEDSDYYDSASAEKIRAIVEKSYPFLSVEEMKAELIKGGLSEELVASLTRSDIITSVQMAIWAYANVNDENFNFDNVTHYGGTLRMKNHPYIPKIFHDYTNECWTWFSQAASYRTFDERTEERVNTLVEYLCDLEPVSLTKEQVVISQLQVVDARLVSVEEESYNITLYSELNGGGNAKDMLTIRAQSYSLDENGNITVTDEVSKAAQCENGAYAIDLTAKEGDSIRVTVDGQQMLPRGVYYYDAGNREISQSLVGVSEGYTFVSAENEIVFTADMVKTPVSDIIIENGEEISVTVGETGKITVTVLPEDATEKDVIFESSDDSILSVDEDGNITANKEGTAIITVTSKEAPSINKTVTVTVNKIEYEIDTPESIELVIGTTQNIGVTVTPDSYEGEIKYSSMDEAVARVDGEGNVTAVGVGRTVIIVEIDGKLFSIPVIVTNPIKTVHHIVFGKTDGIGWYEVSVNGGDFFPQGPNSTLEVEEGSIITVRVQDMWIDDDFTFYVNGKKVEKTAGDSIVLTVDGYMLIGALSMDVEVPDIEESVSLLTKLINFLKALFDFLFGWIQ